MILHRRFARRASLALLTVPFAAGFWRAQAAPVKPNTLSFNVTARFAAESASGTKGPEQQMDARVLVSGNRVRVESKLAERPIVVLYAAPYVYRLLPGSKTGVRYNAPSQTKAGGLGVDAQKLLRNPGTIRALLAREGVKKTGMGALSGVPVDIYSATKLGGQPAKVQAFLRRSDALPLRVQIQARGLRLSASWRDYKRGQTFPASLFSVPGDYRIRASQGRPNAM